jgi:2'-5' RNA ligase
VRLFVSIPVPAHARTHLAGALAGMRTTAVDRWHVTLAFVGEWDDPDTLLEPLSSAASASGPLELRLEGGLSFAGVLSAGVGGDVEGLHALARSVGDACRGVGVQLERRRFRPHVTVARRPRDLTRLDGYSGPPWTAGSFELVRSTLGRDVRHDVLERLPLGVSPRRSPAAP